MSANMLPAIVIAIPISVYFIKLGLYDNILGIALAQELVVLHISTFIMLGGFRALPADLENQANIDGAGMISTFRYVIAPLIKIPLRYFCKNTTIKITGTVTNRAKLAEINGSPLLT